MKNLLTVALCLLSLLPAFGQGLQRQALTTNAVNGLPASGTVPIWNSGTAVWDFGLPAASNTNLPSAVVTNTAHRWEVWAKPLATNQYFANNLGQNLRLFSNDFSGLLQNIANHGVEGLYIHFNSAPYYTNLYWVSNTVTFTNATILEGDGNPLTVFHSPTNLTGPMLQLGTIANPITGIGRIWKIRFEGDNGATNAVGVKVVNCAEPNFKDCEFTGFKFAGIQMSQTNYSHWGAVDDCWFVQKWTSSHGILFDRDPPGSALDQNHFTIRNSIFGSFGGGLGAITVSNRFPNLVIEDNHFRYASGTAAVQINLWAGVNYVISGNQFQNFSAGQYPIYFQDQPANTNYYASVVDNTSYGLGNSPDFLAVIGDRVQGVFLDGNSSRGSPPYFLVGNNGAVNSYGRDGQVLGTLTASRVLMLNASKDLTNIVASSADEKYITASGVATTLVITNGHSVPVSLASGLTVSGGVTNNGVSTNAGQAYFGSAATFHSGVTFLGILSDVSTNLIDGLTEANDAGTNKAVMVHNRLTATLEEVTLGNIGVDWSNLTGVPAGFADGTDDGGAGSVTLGGTNRNIQFQFLGALRGTNDFNYDPTNGRVALNLAGAIPNTSIEIGGASGTAKLRIGDGIGSTNVVSALGMEALVGGLTFTTTSGDWIMNGRFYSLTDESIGFPQFPVDVVHAKIYSNSIPALPTVGGTTATIFGTNQWYRTNIADGVAVTFTASGLLNGVRYFVDGTNGTGVPVWDAGWKWVNSPLLSTGPTLLNSRFTLEVWLQNGETNAAIQYQRTADLAVAGPRMVLLTNATQVIVSNALSLATATVSGAGNGNTNYTINVSTNSINDFYLGSSNVSFTAVMGGNLGTPLYWNVFVTNLSASVWGVNFSAVTNRWKFSGVYGTNAPSVLTNNTLLQISGRSDGTNTLVGYTYYSPAL